MEQNKHRGSHHWKLYAVIAISALPVVASYLTYYVIKPQGRSNYGTLLDPRAYSIPALGLVTLAGEPASLEQYRGKWIMLQIDRAQCDQPCQKKLYDMRQLRLAQGKEMNRIERVWLITDDKPLDTMIMREYDGMRLLRANADRLKAWLPVEAGAAITDHIYMIDPLGNLMMRFPKEADPNKIKKDLGKLLKASRIG